MNKAQRKTVEELLSDVEGLQQLATWQLALVREVKGKIACLIALPGAQGPRTSSPRRAGRRTRKT